MKNGIKSAKGTVSLSFRLDELICGRCSAGAWFDFFQHSHIRTRQAAHRIPDAAFRMFLVYHHAGFFQFGDNNGNAHDFEVFYFYYILAGATIGTGQSGAPAAIQS